MIYRNSDARATTLTTGPDLPVPTAMAVSPAALSEVWRLTRDPQFPAVASPYGTVVVAGRRTVTGYDAVTGVARWSYQRSNLSLCALGSGDTTTAGLKLSGAVRGIVTGYSKGGVCSEITTLNPITGERLFQRTGFTAADSTLVFGGPYGGMISDDLVELWRYDLVRTIQYGNQPEPTKPGTKHLGCAFTDAAVATTQFGTIEHCSPDGGDAQLVLNYDDPGATTDAKTKKWDALNFSPRATVDLQTEHARLLAISADKAAVLVASPEPAVVLYSSSGAELSRTPVQVSADQVIAADHAGRVTPTVIADGRRYVLVGTTLIAIDTDGMTVLWTQHRVRGLPAVVGEDVLVPTDAGIVSIASADGATRNTLPVDRAGFTGRVDLGVVGHTVVESRGDVVVGLRDPDAPTGDATDELPAALTTTAH